MPSSNQPLRSLACMSVLVAASAFPFNFSNTHGDHMVLQRSVNATLWGFGSTFEALSITLENQDMNVSWLIPGVVASDGTWHVDLPAQPAGGPYNISGLQPGTGETWQLSDVLFGDVVLCGGQSNMALGMGSINNSTALIALAANRPGIRIVSPQYSAQNLSQSQWVTEYAINWTSAADFGGQAVAGFSAVCYLTAAQVGVVDLGRTWRACGTVARCPFLL